jgi:hypothetical protein
MHTTKLYGVHELHASVINRHLQENVTAKEIYRMCVVLILCEAYVLIFYLSFVLASGILTNKRNAV